MKSPETDLDALPPSDTRTSCEWCDGKGWVIVTEPSHTSSDGTRDVKAPCDECHAGVVWAHDHAED